MIFWWKIKKPSNLIQDIQYNEEEINSADYPNAINKDTRTFIRYYWALIKIKKIMYIFFLYLYWP